jgi:hypothetical protein
LEIIRTCRKKGKKLSETETHRARKKVLDQAGEIVGASYST